MTKLSDAAGVSTTCFLFLSILRGAWIPAWRGSSLARSYAMSGDEGVG